MEPQNEKLAGDMTAPPQFNDLPRADTERQRRLDEAAERWLRNLDPEERDRLEHGVNATRDDSKGEVLAMRHQNLTNPLTKHLAAQLPVAREAPACQSKGCKGRVTGLNIAPDGEPPRLAYWNKFCDACVDRIKAAEAAKELADNARAQASVWDTFGPQGADNTENIYRAADPAKVHPLHKHHLDTVRDWNPRKKGLLFAGDTGEGKTMVLYLLAKKLISQGIIPELWTSPGLRHAFNMAAKSDDEKARQRLMERLIRIPVLMLDDIGQMAQSQAAEEMLWEVIEGRTSRNKPICGTTQFLGDRFAAKFTTKETGLAIIRRLGQFCTECYFQPTH